MPSYFIPYVYPYLQRNKIKLFKSYSFNDGSILVGIKDRPDTSAADNSLSFIVDNPTELKQVKKDWVFKKTTSFTYDEAPFRVYLLKDKEVKRYWYVLPGKKGIITEDGLFVFDTTLLKNLSSKNHLSYRLQTDSFSTKSDFLAFKGKAKTSSSFLFLDEPNMSFEGSFEVAISFGPGLDSAEKTNEKLYAVCNKVIGKKSFSVFLKPVDKDTDSSKGIKYIIRSAKAGYDAFTDPQFAKGEWTPNVLIVKSYWKN